MTAPSKGRGVVYIATGQTYLRQALRSAESLKRAMPSLETAVFTDCELKPGTFDRIFALSAPERSMRDKIVSLPASPYEETLYLDADTYVAEDLSELFRLLEMFDLAAAHAPARRAFPVNKVPPSFPEYNAGVILFKKSPEVLRFFSDWLGLYDDRRRQAPPPSVKGRKIMKEYPLRDQPTFREVLYASPLRIATLTPEYNCRVDFSGFVSGTVKILHGHHPDLAGLARLINETSAQRVHVMAGDQLKLIQAASQNKAALHPNIQGMFVRDPR